MTQCEKCSELLSTDLPAGRRVVCPACFVALVEGNLADEMPAEGTFGRYGLVAVLWRWFAGWPLRIGRDEWDRAMGRKS